MKSRNLLIILTIFMFLIILISLYYILHSSDQYIDAESIELSPKITETNKFHTKLGQKKMTNMLKEFDKIVSRYGIEYFAHPISGTNIGAILYKGFIPWDHDIDIIVEEKYREKLRTILSKELPDNMYFQYVGGTDKNYHIKNIDKIRDTTSCYTHLISSNVEWENKDPSKKFYMGLQIDISYYNIQGDKVYIINDKKYCDYSDIFPLKKVPFEDTFINISNTTKLLDDRYGKKWRVLPPVKDRISHEGQIDALETCSFHYELYGKNGLPQKI